MCLNIVEGCGQASRFIRSEANCRSVVNRAAAVGRGRDPVAIADECLNVEQFLASYAEAGNDGKVGEARQAVSACFQPTAVQGVRLPALLAG